LYHNEVNAAVRVKLKIAGIGNIEVKWKTELLGRNTQSA